MNLYVVEDWTPTSQEWDDLWLECPYATYFQSREWAEIWQKYSHNAMRPAPWTIKLSNGIKIIFPFSKENLYFGIVQRHTSSPGGTYGGWLANRSLVDSERKAVLKIIAKRYPDLLWRFSPFENTGYDCGHLIRDQTHAIDMSIGLEAIYKSWTKGHASAVQKAKKSGIEICIGRSAQDWRDYFFLYQHSLSRWGKNATSCYSWELFAEISQRKSPNTTLWLAKHQGGVIAGALCLYSPSHAAYWHGAALSAYFGLRPVHLLMYNAIHDAAARGCKWFDFNPSGGHSGVAAFKKSFGSREISSDILHTSSVTHRILRNIDRQLQRVRR